MKAEFKRVLESQRDLVPLAALVAGLCLLSSLLAGDRAIPPINGERLLFIGTLAAMYGLAYLAAALVDSVGQAFRRRDPATGQVALGRIWPPTGRNPLPGMLALGLAAYGATASGNLTEIYRTATLAWHDPFLWDLEYPLFRLVRGSWLDWPAFWDGIYFQMWSFVILAAIFAYRDGGPRRSALLGCAIVLAFHIARCINLAFPTAGPVFYQPAWFSLEGSFSQGIQELLRQYMAGGIPANGVLPATMAMPSLHVGLTGMAVFFLARTRIWTLCFGLPWLFLIWTSTVVLGWHYALDGLGGLAVAALAVALADGLQRSWDRLLDSRLPLPVAPLGAAE